MKPRKKICTKCGRKLWLKDFYMAGNGYHSAHCKECQKADKREKYAQTSKVPDGIIFRHGRLVEHKGMSVKIYWSSAMIEEFKRKYPFMKNDDLAGIFGVSVRTVTRKARELGVCKNEEWLHRMWDGHRKMALLAANCMHNPGAFKKGQHSYPAGEFKPGHKESEETKRKRIASLKLAWERRKRVV